MTASEILENDVAPVSSLKSPVLQDAGERQPQCAASFDERLEDRVGIEFVGVDDCGDGPGAPGRKLMRQG